MEVCVHAGGFRGVVVLYNADVFVLSCLPEFGAVCAEAHALLCSFRVGSSSWQWLGVGSPVVPWHSHMPDRRQLFHSFVQSSLRCVATHYGAWCSHAAVATAQHVLFATPVPV